MIDNGINSITQTGRSREMPTLFGNQNNNTLNGGGQSDKIYGHGKNDKLYGHGGSDELYGDRKGPGYDKTVGSPGDDELHGGNGNDKLYGDAGKDKFYGDGGKDSHYGGAGGDKFYFGKKEGGDTIYDFKNQDDIYLKGNYTDDPGDSTPDDGKYYIKENSPGNYLLRWNNHDQVDEYYECYVKGDSPKDDIWSW
jgi:Ca2+-binding RTX toxin-like protein